MPTKPTHNAFSVRKYFVNGEERSEFCKIGAAFAHRSGKGFNLKLVATPVDGEIVLLEPRDSEPTSEELVELEKE